MSKFGFDLVHYKEVHAVEGPPEISSSSKVSFGILKLHLSAVVLRPDFWQTRIRYPDSDLAIVESIEYEDPYESPINFSMLQGVFGELLPQTIKISLKVNVFRFEL